MKSINLVALQPFEFEGHSYVQGEVFEARPIAAAVLTRARSARFNTDADRPESEPEHGLIEPNPPAVETAKEAVVKVRRPRRKRRDIARTPQTKA